MEIFISIISILVSAAISWFLSRKKYRLLTKAEKLEKKREWIKSYSETTGYKNIIHDCFAIITLAIGALLISVGIELMIFTQLSEANQWILLIIHSSLSGLLIGIGIALLETFQTLKKAHKPQEAIAEIARKIEKYNSEASKH